MTSKQTILIITLLISCLTTFGQKKDPIDKFLEDCMNKPESETTAGSVSCVGQAYKMWDTELNLQYKNLMNSLNPTQKQKLKTAQIEWIKFRDLEFDLIDAIYADFGTMGQQMSASDKMEVVKKRALELKSLNETINN